VNKDKLLASLAVLLIAAGTLSGAATAEEDPFKGRLFPPQVILEHRDELALSESQFSGIRAAVVEVQSSVAEYEWDMQQAYLALIAEIDERPIDEDAVLEHAQVALSAENEVKKRQMMMLVRLKNLLTDRQIDYLESITNQ
jgi:hypothetical protein